MYKLTFNHIQNFIKSGLVVPSFIVAVIKILFNVISLYAINFSPNPAYVLIILNLHVFMVLLLHYLLYKKNS